MTEFIGICNIQRESIMILQQMYQSQEQRAQGYLPVSIKGYKVHSIVGSGGQAIVYLATKQEVDGVVSIKVYGNDSQSNNSYLRELNILNQLNHPNVIKMKSFNPSAEVAYLDSKRQQKPIIVLQFAYYGDLYNLVQVRQMGLPLRAAKYFFVKILESLLYLQQNNICHRDIKLENILIDKNLNIKLIDFGISSKISDVIDQNNQTRNFGSTYCKAPETYRSAYKCEKVDVFSAGVLLFCMCLGRLPFQHAGFSCKKYECIRMGREENFWKYHVQKSRRKGSQILGDKEFRSLFMKMCCYDASLRPNYVQLLQDDWLNENVATKLEIKQLIEEKFEYMLKENSCKNKDYDLIHKLTNEFEDTSRNRISGIQTQ